MGGEVVLHRFGSLRRAAECGGNKQCRAAHCPELKVAAGRRGGLGGSAMLRQTERLGTLLHSLQSTLTRECIVLVGVVLPVEILTLALLHASSAAIIR